MFVPIWLMVTAVAVFVVAVGVILAAIICAISNQSGLMMQNAALGNEVSRLLKENKQLEKDKHVLAEAYVKVQNEYAWHRIMMREGSHVQG